MNAEQKTVTIGDVVIGGGGPLTLIAGPCQLEGLDHALMIASAMAKATAAAGVGYVFKASYDKANRTSLKGKRGVGMDAGLEILSKVKAEIGCPVLTDVHEPHQCAPVAEAVDVLQIPAYLCRQTDLLIAAGKTALRSMSKRASSLRRGTWPM